MPGLQPTHILIIIVVALIILVPSRLPAVARALREAMFEFRQGLQRDRQDDL